MLRRNALLGHFLLVDLLLVVHCFSAIFEVEIVSFRSLNNELIAESDRCDNPAVDKHNPCDYVFYIDECFAQRADAKFYTCFPKVVRFYAPSNTDNVFFNGSVPRPMTRIAINGQFPATLMLNITVWDEDDGYSGDDFVGNYKIYLNPSMLGRGGKQFSQDVEHYVTIPQHSEIVVRYRGYCEDFDCSNSNGPEFLNLVDPREPTRVGGTGDFDAFLHRP